MLRGPSSEVMLRAPFSDVELRGPLSSNIGKDLAVVLVVDVTCVMFELNLLLLLVNRTVNVTPSFCSLYL